MISLLGIPYDANSSYVRGAAQGPAAIREALHCDSANLWTEDLIDLGRTDLLHDSGDLKLPEEVEPAFATIEAAVASELDAGRTPICLGGDHSITLPIMRGLRRYAGQLEILLFDAHSDLYDQFQGSRYSHACQFARIMEEKLARRLVQVGIRTQSRHQVQQAARFGVEVITMREIARFDQFRFDGPLYISFDLDVLDPAFAPGVAHHEPGGISVREALTMIQSLRAPIVGADIVEMNPARDRLHQTGMVAAKVLKEIAARMLRAK
jgi:agmatinase